MLSMLGIHAVTMLDFGLAFSAARRESDKVATATSDWNGATRRRYYLSRDHRSGFAVTDTGELVYVFSLERGRGETLLNAAIAAGATHLDCFDGYLPGLYAQHGFVEYGREPNWTPGGPDVVYMRLLTEAVSA